MKKLYQVIFKEDKEVLDFLVECTEHFGVEDWEPSYVPKSIKEQYFNDDEDEEDYEEDYFSKEDYEALLDRYKKAKKLYLALEKRNIYGEEGRTYIDALLSDFEETTGIPRDQIDYYQWSPYKS